MAANKNPDAEPRTGRAVLGDKTRNARTGTNNHALQAKTPSVRDIDKSQVKPTTLSRPRQAAPKSDGSRLQILLDSSDPLSGDVDTNPPPPPEQPYESDVFPAGVLTFDAIRPENRLKGYCDFYHNRRDENGLTRVDRELKSAQEKRFREADARVRKDLEETVWDLGLESPKKIVPLADPAHAHPVRPVAAKAPSTINSRRAASALGMASVPSSTALHRKPLSSKSVTTSTKPKVPSFMQPTKARQMPTATLASRPKAIPSSSSAAGIAASRSTLGYNKGRSVSTALHTRSKSEAPARPIARSNTTATAAPASRAVEMEKPEFVSIFDVPPEEDDGDGQLFGAVEDDGLFGRDEAIDVLDAGEEDEDDFRLELDL